jgi:PD-(D/E)XK endonuclease
LDNVRSTDQKGATAETAIVHAAIKLGIDVYRPQMEGGRYDMIFDLGARLVRVQCKWAPRHGDVIVLRCYSSRRNRDGVVRRVYLEDEIDAFAAYCEELDECYFVPFEHEFAARLGPPGAVAQLGERRAGSA